MSVLHKFQVKIANYGYDPRKVYLLGEYGDRSLFNFSFLCTAQLPIRKVNFFFDLDTNKVLVLYRDMDKGLFDCEIMGFHIYNDYPVFAVEALSMNQMKTMIAESFKEQHATWLFDKMINQPESQSV